MSGGGGSGSPAGRREAWRSAAALMDARFEQGRSSVRDAIVVDRGPWTIRVGTFFVQSGSTAVTHTGARAYFRGLRSVRLKVRRRNLLDDVLEALGVGERLRLDRELSRRYVVRGTPAARLPSVFTGNRLARTLVVLPPATLVVERTPWRLRRRYGEDSGVASCRVPGVRTDAGTLAGLATVVSETLSALARMGEARGLSLPEEDGR